MAHTRMPPIGALEQVGQQLRERLIVGEDSDAPSFSFESLNAVASPLSSTVELGATFELWRLSPSAIEETRPGVPLGKLAKRIGWHHQVRLDDKSLGFARSSSKLEDEKSFSVDAIFVADVADGGEEINLAEEIHKAILWANDNIGDEKVANLLTAPAYQVEAMWFVDERDPADGDVFIISLPSDFQGLREGKLFSTKQFLDALRNETPVQGLIHKRVAGAGLLGSSGLIPFHGGLTTMATKKSSGKISGGGSSTKIGTPGKRPKKSKKGGKLGGGGSSTKIGGTGRGAKQTTPPPAEAKGGGSSTKIGGKGKGRKTYKKR